MTDSSLPSVDVTLSQIQCTGNILYTSCEY